MQGTAADIIKRAMLAVDEWIAKQQCQDDVRMLMQVHDELVFEIAEQKIDTYVKKLSDVMEQAASLDVPLIAEAGVGINWDEAH
jgi:DNA polymerase-1